jgi:hypothetical protein
MLFLEGTQTMPGLPDMDGVSKYVSVVTKSLKQRELEFVFYLLLINVEVRA